VRVEAEFTVEPFVEGSPGPHVTAAIEAARAAGVEPDMGPFGTTIAGEVDDVLRALGEALRAATGSGADRISVQITVDGR
jgi:uncharacterized protein YqgV (UPF0045/DUF77 family)